MDPVESPRKLEPEPDPWCARRPTKPAWANTVSTEYRSSRLGVGVERGASRAAGEPASRAAVREFGGMVARATGAARAPETPRRRTGAPRVSVTTKDETLAVVSESPHASKPKRRLFL